LMAIAYGALYYTTSKLLLINAFFTSLIAYSITIPLSFYLQKKWVFNASANFKNQFDKFLITHVANLLFVTISTYIFSIIYGQKNILLEIIISVSIGPPLTFILLNNFVFREKT
jgi:putative flippase GtrA